MNEILYVTEAQAMQWHNYSAEAGGAPDPLTVEFDDGTVVTMLAVNGKITVSAENAGVSIGLIGNYDATNLLAGFRMSDMDRNYNIDVELV